MKSNLDRFKFYYELAEDNLNIKKVSYLSSSMRRDIGITYSDRLRKRARSLVIPFVRLHMNKK